MTAPEREARAEEPVPHAHRLPPDLHLGRVHLQVADLERSLDYYQRVLGFRALQRSGAHAVLGARGDDRALLELHGHPGAAPVPPRGRLGLYHFAILLPHRAALGSFAAHLAEVGARAGASDHSVSEALYLRDPDGLGIEVYADRARAARRYYGSELRMDTTPLDVAGLVRAAGGAPWSGLPAGTVVGHIHLHVGDLERAERFYGAALGLDVTVRSYPGALFLAAGGYHHHLGVNTWAGDGAAPPGRGEARLLEWELVLPSMSEAEAAGARLERAGHPVRRVEGGWAVTDPWDLPLRITTVEQRA